MKDATQFPLKQLITFIRGQNYWWISIWNASRGQRSVGVATAVSIYLSFDRFISFLILNVHLANKKAIKSKVNWINDIFKIHLHDFWVALRLNKNDRFFAYLS